MGGLLKILPSDVWSRILARLDEIHLASIRGLDLELAEKYYKTYRLPWICNSVYDGSWSKMTSLRMNTNINGQSKFYCYVHKKFENIELEYISQIDDLDSGFYCHQCKNHCFHLNDDNIMHNFTISQDENDEIFIILCINCQRNTNYWKCTGCHRYFLDTVPYTRGEGEPEEVKRCVAPECSFQYKPCTCSRDNSDSDDMDEVCWVCQGNNI